VFKLAQLLVIQARPVTLTSNTPKPLKTPNRNIYNSPVTPNYMLKIPSEVKKALGITVSKKTEDTLNTIIENLIGQNRMLEFIEPHIPNSYGPAHDNRLVIISYFLAKEVISKKLNYQKENYQKEYVKTIARSTRTHDIGKCLIAKKLLDGTTELTDYERDVIKIHPIIGNYLLYSKVPEEKKLERYIKLVIALQHHERCDGSGYPKGLTRDEIDIAARITMVADIYDAARQNRPHKKGVSHKEAMEILRMESEKGLIDSEVYNAAVKIENILERIENKYTDKIYKEYLTRKNSN
jgi:HD-GYP domain-containing protein (c-di-GMP phosphodiesterase class II)